MSHSADSPRETFVCIHGHFYQPPREDPLTGLVPRELGAEPYANFNEKITAECYRPNAELGNFRRLSFDIGPTLATWLSTNASDVLASIVESDVGNAFAQAYSHSILPLATRRDKTTQVRWGMADFKHRFKRAPRGMWLPECGVDHETLEVLAENGIEFTILAPSQAATADVDVGRPYRVPIAGERSMVVFFFDPGLSGEVSFNPDATRDAAAFASSRFDADRPLSLIASDGELYGHHQRGREHFLHDLLFQEVEAVGRTVIHPAAYLDRFGAADAVEIVDRSSWSCAHGIDRWSTGCSCTAGDSSWKRVVRQALDALTGDLDAVYEREGGALLLDPWLARDTYVQVLLGERALAAFLATHRGRDLSPEDEWRAGLLLEAQVYGQRMHTSCGLFWDDLSGLEMRNNLAYAAMAIRCIEQASGVALGSVFRDRLRDAWSAQSGRNGTEIYDEIDRARLR
ncbi:MAG: hypothetical protein HW416_2098 [Chloroflexi bacterium]|nr:hypothetical protein [Chloroflexota bacterium]